MRTDRSLWQDCEAATEVEAAAKPADSQSWRVVLVEGVPFTGKSTLSEMVAEQTRLNGIEVQWLCEGALLARHFRSYIESPVADLETLREEWKSFADSMAQTQASSIIDSAISFPGVDALMPHMLEREQILQEMSGFMVPSSALRPHVIHLLGDPDRLVSESVQVRGQKWREQLERQCAENPYQRAKGQTGLAGAAALMAEEQEIVTEVLQRSGWPVQAFSVEDARAEILSRALEFLGLQFVEPPLVEVPVARLEALVGDYSVEGSGTLTVRYTDEALFLFRDEQCYGPLIPEASDRFRLQAAGITLVFDESASAFEMTHPVRPLTVYRRSS